MSTLFILLPLTLAGMVAAGYAFIWAVRSDQFDDMEGPAHQILFDEDIRPLKQDDLKDKTADVTKDLADDATSMSTTDVINSENQNSSEQEKH
ncbi:cbb3-type cytochrome oxidase assembly protein CcoS [Ignatzschineria ureiclastica]|uniref:Cbb3-type cytochrome oxidase assembly protein CcoS n=2 Tax=Ignatzschineria ureiclastica TaxID=472582 RepID=A0A2U2AEG3_9GAMM|nr:cbb3-type cytochrome oxidase assembly protein CcoS [Ignatzschineria ureiclastica]